MKALYLEAVDQENNGLFCVVGPHLYVTLGIQEDLRLGLPEIQELRDFLNEHWGSHPHPSDIPKDTNKPEKCYMCGTSLDGIDPTMDFSPGDGPMRLFCPSCVRSVTPRSKLPKNPKGL